MGFWHTGYLDHVETGYEGCIIPTDLKLNICKTCQEAFSTQDDLIRHRFENHPFFRPVLFMRGDELPSTRKVITRPLNGHEITFNKVDRVRIEGMDVPIDQFCEKLSGYNSGVKAVVLYGGGSEVEYELEFAIPSKEEIAEIDQKFYEVIATTDILDLRTINFLIDSVKISASAARYLDGVVAYLYGVLAKDQKGETELPIDKYREKYNQSLDILRDYDTPTARLICGIVNFNFNVFNSTDPQTLAAPKLKTSIKYFQKVLLNYDQQVDDANASPLGQTPKRIPLDSSTERIIEYSLMEDSALSKDIEDIQTLSGKSHLMPEDRFKLRVIAVDYALRHNDKLSLKELLSPVINDAVYGEWAKRHLDNIGG